MKKVLPIVVVIVAIVAVLALALGNKNNKNAPAPPPTPSNNQSSPEPMSSNTNSNVSNQPASTNTVSIENFNYSPSSITVKKGTMVTWTNNDTTAHTVTSDSGSKDVFDSGSIDHGKTFSTQFNTAGTIKYHCTFHPDMHGTVIVTE
jgi:plastocyanin